MITPEQRHSFERNGFLHLPGMLDEQACNEVIEHVWSLLPERFSSDPKTWTGPIQDCCSNQPLYQRRGLLRFKHVQGYRGIEAIDRAIYDNKRLIQAMEQLLDRRLNRILVRGLHPNFPMPSRVSINELLGNRMFSQRGNPHRPLFRIPRPPLLPIGGHLDTHAMELGVIAYLNDIGPKAGGLAVWPGSHRLFELAFDSKVYFLPTPLYKRALKMFQRYRPVTLEGRKGDVYVFHNRLMHSKTYNLSPHIRHAILVDALGADWKNVDSEYRRSPERARLRKKLAAIKKVELHEPAQSILRDLALDPVSNFLADHPRIRGMVNAISKDASAGGRRNLSAKIRQRQEGDYWIVISQGAEQAKSFKLDAYGDPRNGRYDLYLNGIRQVSSEGGIIVERLPLTAGRNEIRVTGRMMVTHYLRLIRSANPLHRSPIIATKVIEAESTSCCLEVDVVKEKASAPGTSPLA